MVLLKDAAFRSGAGVTTGFTQTQLELIAYGYQLGVLLLPTVASPISTPFKITGLCMAAISPIQTATFGARYGWICLLCPPVNNGCRRKLPVNEKSDPDKKTQSTTRRIPS